MAGRAIAFALPLAIVVAWLLSRPTMPGRFLLNAVAHAPLVLPPVVVGYVLLLLFGVRGPIGAVLYHSLHVRLAFTGWGAALAAGVMAFPLMVRALRLSLLSFAIAVLALAASEVLARRAQRLAGR